MTNLDTKIDDVVQKHKTPSVDAPASAWVTYISKILHDYYYIIENEPDKEESDWQHRKASLQAQGCGRAVFIIDEIISPKLYRMEKSQDSMKLEDELDFKEPVPGETYVPDGYNY